MRSQKTLKLLNLYLICKFYCTRKHTNLLYNIFCGDKCRSHEEVDLIMCGVNFLGVNVSWLEVNFLS